MKKWQYKVALFDSIKLEKELNRHGDSGWEACSMARECVTLDYAVYEVVFKRPAKVARRPRAAARSRGTCIYRDPA